MTFVICCALVITATVPSKLWQYVFPMANLSRDPRNGVIGRHHASPSGLEQAVRKAVQLSGIAKPERTQFENSAFTSQGKSRKQAPLPRCNSSLYLINYCLRTPYLFLSH